LPAILRFLDAPGEADRLPELLEIARQRKLPENEVRMLADALRRHEPWLEWAGKREKPWFEADPSPLHIQERVSTRALLPEPAGTEEKHQAARRWVVAVNNWGELGRWEFSVCRDQRLAEVVADIRVPWAGI
jgi:hypothetical protein